MKKKAIVSVINDLVTDQRVHRTCITLTENGYDVLLVGRKQRKSLPLPQRAYQTKRMKLLFEKGVPFYLTFQCRLFWFLLFHKADLFFSNDLDTLMPNFFVSKLKSKPLIYDSHEYFTGVPELQENPLKQKTWKLVERVFLPRLKYLFTVNESIAGLYNKEFELKEGFRVMRNLPLKRELPTKISRTELGLPEDKNIILLQGAGINVDRGVEEAIEAMRYVNNGLLLIVGGGDAIEELKAHTNKLQLNDRVTFIPKQPFEKLMQYTIQADLGLSLDKDSNINYRYSLPNKLFDYIHAEVPVLVSPIIEVKKIVQHYNVGECITTHSPQEIAGKINTMLADKAKLALYKENAHKAKEELCWDKEKQVLLTVLHAL